jgi:diphthine-ammonia ligase
MFALFFKHDRDEAETVVHSDDAFAPVGYLRLKTCHLENKD